MDISSISEVIKGLDAKGTIDFVIQGVQKSDGKITITGVTITEKQQDPNKVAGFKIRE